MTRPTSGYVSYVRVRFSECDPLGHVNNAVYLNYLEQVAIDHAAALGWTSTALIHAASALFVARRHEIDYFQPAFEGDLLRVRTWATDMRGARGYRVYDISRVSPEEDRIALVDRLLLPDELVPPSTIRDHRRRPYRVGLHEPHHRPPRPHPQAGRRRLRH